MTLFFQIITEFGGPLAVFAVGILALAMYGFREGVRYGFIIGISCGIGWLLKEIFAAQRPYDAGSLTWAPGYSFPSLHTLAIVIITLYVFFTFIRYSRFSKATKICIACDLIILAVLVGWSRVFLSAHFWEDIFAGAILGVMFYFMLAGLFDRFAKEELSRTCKSLKQTKRLAQAFARHLRKQKRAIILFEAQMGAGKTTFTRTVVKGLGTRATATSPTFSIINKYGDNIYHVDLYRVEDISELQNTDFYEIIAGDNFVFIEWSEKFDIIYPRGVTRVKIDVKGDDNRVFDITC